MAALPDSFRAARPMARTLRALARLIAYPDAALRAHAGELRDALHAERALGAARLAELDALAARLACDGAADDDAAALQVEAVYVDIFDRGRGTALHLFEHVHGDSRDRGPAMVDLVRTYEAAGLMLAPGELPDHLSVVLEYASTQPAAQAAAFLREIAHIAQSILAALRRRRSDYACVPGALLDLAGEPEQPAAAPAASIASVAPATEPTLDESWEEPAVFGGCSSAGQSRPGEPQPVRIVRKPAAPPHPASAAQQQQGARA